MKKLSLALATALLLATGANAAEYTPNQFYVGADFGGSNLTDGFVISVPLVLGQVNGGYQFHPNFALEAGYFHTQKREDNSEYFTSSLSLHGAYLDAVGNYNLTEHFRVLGSLGAAYINVDYKSDLTAKGAQLFEEDTSEEETGSEFTPKLGLGFSYDVSENITARTLVNYYNTEVALVTYTAGLQYRF